MATNGNGDARSKFEAEVGLVLDTYDNIAVSPVDWRERQDYDYLYRKGQYLVADRDLDRARKLLGDVRVVENLMVGVTLLQGEDWNVDPILGRVDDELGP